MVAIGADHRQTEGQRLDQYIAEAFPGGAHDKQVGVAVKRLDVFGIAGKIDLVGQTTGTDEVIKPGLLRRFVHAEREVRRLTREVRIQAKYDRSLGVLRYLKEQGARRTKSGIMLGLGETREEVVQTLEDLREAGVDVVTIGQYLQPTRKHLPVKEFITPDQFDAYREIGLELGFRHVESGALVRSSYHAHKHIH